MPKRVPQGFFRKISKTLHFPDLENVVSMEFHVGMRSKLRFLLITKTLYNPDKHLEKIILMHKNKNSEIRVQIIKANIHNLMIILIHNFMKNN